MLISATSKLATMRTIIIASLFYFISFPSHGQKDPKEILNQELIGLLQADGVLLTDAQKDCTGNCLPNSPWKNKSQKSREIKKDENLRIFLLKKFKTPRFIDGKTMDPNFIFRDKSIGKLGSYIIRNNNFSVINNTEPSLPVLISGNQLSVPNPKSDGTNYLLNFTSSTLFSFSLDGTLSGGFKTYFDAKSSISNSLSDEKRTQLSIGTGIFENQLGTIFRKSINKQVVPIDFEPLYQVWVEHANGKILPNDKIIESFEGMALYVSTGTKYKNTLTWNADLNSSGSFPFLSYGLQSNTKWDRSTQLTTQSNIYDIFMFNNPSLIEIPTVDQLLNNWNALAGMNYNNVKLSSKSVPANSPLIINVTFGPIPNSNILPIIKLDEPYSLDNMTRTKFIKSIKLINDPTRIKVDANTLSYTFDIEIIRDELFIATNSPNAKEIFTTEFPLRIFIDNAAQGKYLERVYDKIQIETDRYPTPSYTDYVIVPTKDTNGDFIYKGRIRFTVKDGMNIGTTPQPPRITDVFGLPSSVDQQLKALIKNSTFKLVGTNEFDFQFIIPAKSKFFDINQRNFEVDLLLDFHANLVGYSRRLPINIMGSSEQISLQSTSNIIVENNETLINSLNPMSILSDGTLTGDLIKKFTNNSGIEVLQLIEELKKVSNLMVGPDNKYLIDQRYLNLNSLIQGTEIRLPKKQKPL